MASAIHFKQLKCYDSIKFSGNGRSQGRGLRDMGHPSDPICMRCGKCCLTDLIAYATEEDRKRWTREGRTDILHILEKEHGVWAGDRLVSQDDGHLLQGCPFFTCDGTLGICTIHETRPRVCRDYVPGSSEFCPHYKGRKCRA